jgi:hypothetical protein
MNDELKQRLGAMLEEDQRVRAELAATGELFQGYAPRMAEVHNRNAQALWAIVERFGWPGTSLVGAEGAHAAWFILQHAIGQPELQRGCLALLKADVANHDADPAQVAHLEDRICFFERRPQRYGTQFDWDEHGQMRPWTLADPEHVDQYRQAVGLGPLGERIEQVRQEARSAPPPDYQQRQEEMRAWARSVGWHTDRSI